jgi:hypothetical protein
LAGGGREEEGNREKYARRRRAVDLRSTRKQGATDLPTAVNTSNRLGKPLTGRPNAPNNHRLWEHWELRAL